MVCIALNLLSIAIGVYNACQQHTQNPLPRGVYTHWAAVTLLNYG